MTAGLLDAAEFNNRPPNRIPGIPDVFPKVCICRGSTRTPSKVRDQFNKTKYDALPGQASRDHDNGVEARVAGIWWWKAIDRYFAKDFVELRTKDKVSFTGRQAPILADAAQRSTTGGRGEEKRDNALANNLACDARMFAESALSPLFFLRATASVDVELRLQDGAGVL